MWAKWLHQPYNLGSPQRSAREQKLEMATRPTCGQIGYITRAVFGVPNVQRGDTNRKWPCGPHVGKVGTSPPPSWGSPTPSAGTKIRNTFVAHMWAKWRHHPSRLGGPQRSAREQKSEMAKGPTCGRSGYMTPAVLGVPNAQRGVIRNGYVAHMWAKWLHHPGRLGVPQHSAQGQKLDMAMRSTCGQGGHITPAVLGSQMLKAGTKIRNGFVAHMWAKWL